MPYGMALSDFSIMCAEHGKGKTGNGTKSVLPHFSKTILGIIVFLLEFYKVPQVRFSEKP